MDETKSNVYSLFADVQAELLKKDYGNDKKVSVKSEKATFSYDYTTFGKIMLQMRETLTAKKCGISISVPEHNGDWLRVQVQFYCADGSISSDYWIARKLSGDLIKDIGGLYTYAKRYAVAMFFALPIGEFDPDDEDREDEPKPTAQKAQPNPPAITLKQLEQSVTNYAVANGLVEDTKAYKDEHFQGRLTNQLSEHELQELFSYLKMLGEK
jgi:hypothetical protein